MAALERKGAPKSRPCVRAARAAAIPPGSPHSARSDPIDLLIASNRQDRIVPLRHGRMLASPFAFYRGADDLAASPASSLRLQVYGDCHLLNFGGFATPERRLIFDINDFDETLIAPWEWDVKRLAASFVLAARSNGFSDDNARDAARASVTSYREQLAKYAEMPVLNAWYAANDLEAMIAMGEDGEFRRYIGRKVQKAADGASRDKEFAKLTYLAGARPRIRDEPPLIFHDAALNDDQILAQARADLADYAETMPPWRRVLLDRYAVTDATLRVVGVGSVGTYCGIALLISGNGDALFLQFKEARESVLERYAGQLAFAHAGQRVAKGQCLMQAASDMFLGWFTTRSGRQFYVRQLRDAKVKPTIELMTSGNLTDYAKARGWSLARARARSGDAMMLAGYLGSGEAFDEAIARFSMAYADQTERDHAALVHAVRAGRVEAMSDPAL